MVFFPPQGRWAIPAIARVIVFELIMNNNQKMHFWSAICLEWLTQIINLNKEL